MSFVVDFRKALSQPDNSKPYTLLDKKGSKIENSLEAEAIDLNGTKYQLSSPSGYKAYSCWTVLYFYENRKLEQAEYISQIAKLGQKLPPSGASISFVDRKDLLDFITGVSSSSVHVKLEGSEKVKEVGKGSKPDFSFDLDEKRSLLPPTIQDDIRAMKALKTYQRTINNPSNILCVTGSKNFSSIEKPAFSAFSSMKSVKKLGATSTRVPAKNNGVSKKTASAPSKHDKSSSEPKIIIIPAGAQSLLTLYNVKSFLIDQKYSSFDSRFIDSEEIRKQGAKKPAYVEISRDPKKLSPFIAKNAGKFVVYDSVDSLSSKDWYDNHLLRSRIVAVFATGQQWQFDNWNKEFKEPVKLFSTVLGFSLRYQDEPPAGMIPKWNVKQLQG